MTKYNNNNDNNNDNNNNNKNSNSKILVYDTDMKFIMLQYTFKQLEWKVKGSLEFA